MSARAAYQVNGSRRLRSHVHAGHLHHVRRIRPGVRHGVVAVDQRELDSFAEYIQRRAVPVSGVCVQIKQHLLIRRLENYLGHDQLGGSDGRVVQPFAERH